MAKTKTKYIDLDCLEDEYGVEEVVAETEGGEGYWDMKVAVWRDDQQRLWWAEASWYGCGGICCGSPGFIADRQRLRSLAPLKKYREDLKGHPFDKWEEFLSSAEAALRAGKP